MIEEVGVAWTEPIDGKRAPEGSVGSGEKATDSSCLSYLIPSAGLVIRRPEDSSLRIERSVGRMGESFSAVDLRATLGFL